MANLVLRAIFGGSLLLLAACGGKPESNAPAAANEETANAMAGGNMAGMAMPTKASTASGQGTVKAIDAAAGKITLDHGPSPEAGWPAMSMTFDVKAPVLQGISVGDKVSFDLTLKNGGGEVTVIKRALTAG